MAPDQKTVFLAVRVTERLKRLAGETAEKSGLSLSDWIRAVVARAANEGAFAPTEEDIPDKDEPKEPKKGRKRPGR